MRNRNRFHTRLRAGTANLGRKIANLFAAGQAGAWYDYGLLTQEYQDSAGTTPVTAVEQPLGKVNDLSGRNNHLTQATAGARPVASARVNLLLSSEAFGGTGWTAASEYTYTQQALLSGSVYLTLAIPTAVSARHVVYQSFNITGAKNITFFVKPAGYRYLQILDFSNGQLGGVVFDAQAGVFTQNSVALSNTIEALANGVYKVTLSFDSTLAVALGFRVSLTATVVDAFGDFYTGDGVSGVYLGGLQYATGATTPYQRVNTATDYNTAGFPTYAKFDGVDDSLTSATGGGATTGFFWCGAVKPLGGAGAVRTIFSDVGANTGYKVQLDTANKLSFSAGNGAAYTTIASTATVDVGVNNLITAWDDGTNLNVQINNATAQTVARPTVTAGTTSFTVGKDNGAATSFVNGNLYPEIYRTGTPLTAAEIAAAQAWCKAKAGI